MGAKLGLALFLVLFAVPFSGVGVYAAWAIAGVVRQSNAAADWVVVKATVEEASLRESRGRKGGRSYEALGKYRYSYDGKAYVGKQLGLDLTSASDNVGAWQQDMAAFLIDAREKGQSISIYVNPDNPAQAVVDRDIRWGMVLFLGMFGVIFGGAGLGTLVAAGNTLFSSDDKKRATAKKKQVAWAAERAASPASTSREGPIRSDAMGGAIAMWIFALFWNALAFPAAILGVPNILRQQEYWALFVLLFPLIGLFIAWAAIHQTWGILRRGRVTLELQPDIPRGGQIINGVVRFARGIGAGQVFDIRLERQQKKSRSGNRSSKVDWWKDVTATTSQGPDGPRLAFRLGVATKDVPPESPAFDNDRTWYEWRLLVTPGKGTGGISYSFPVSIQHTPGSTAGEEEADLLRTPSASERQIEALFGQGANERAGPQLREAYASLSPQNKELLAKTVATAKVAKVSIDNAAGAVRRFRGIITLLVVLVIAWFAYESYTLYYATP